MWFKTSYPQTKAILFFDGTCPFCHAMVRFVLVRDKYDLLNFAPLQGETMKEKNIDTRGMDSIILYTENGKTLYKSDAAISSLERLGGLWFILAKIMKLIPRVLRDLFYDLIAKIRYKMAGKTAGDSCPLLAKNYQSKILL
jgi:predicted DCC family thiol-disulfide oxidoreductase YuxK